MCKTHDTLYYWVGTASDGRWMRVLAEFKTEEMFASWEARFAKQKRPCRRGRESIGPPDGAPRETMGR